MVKLLFLIVSFILCISHSLYIHRTTLTNCDLTRLSHDKKFDHLRCRNVLYLPSPISQSLTFRDNLDDDHFCSLLADKGFITNYIHKIHEKWHANAYHVALEQAVKHIITINNDMLHPLIIIANEISALHALKYMEHLKRTSPVGIVLVDPPPLHALLTETNRMRILEERFFSLSQEYSIQPNQPFNMIRKYYKQRLKKKIKRDETRLVSLHPHRQMMKELRSGKLGTTDLFGEDLPSISTIIQNIQPECIQVISTDDASSKRVSVSLPQQHGVYCDDTYIANTDGYLRAPEDYWGRAAAIELAELCSTLPVLCLSVPEEKPPSFLPPHNTIVWTDVAVDMHRDITEAVNQLMRNILLKQSFN